MLKLEQVHIVNEISQVQVFGYTWFYYQDRVSAKSYSTC